MHKLFIDKLIRKGTDKELQALCEKASNKDKISALAKVYEQKHINDLEKRCSALSEAYTEDPGNNDKYTMALERKVELAEEALETAIIKEFKAQLMIAHPHFSFERFKNFSAFVPHIEREDL